MKQETHFESVNSLNLSLYDFNKIAISWNVNFIQLRPGKFSGDLYQIAYQDFLFSYARFNTAVKQEGFSPDGVWTFAFINDIKVHWRNYIVEPESVIIYAPGSEINAVSEANFEVMTFSIPDNYLFELAKKEGAENIYHALKSIDVMTTKNPLWSVLRKSIYNEIVKQLKNRKYNNSLQFKETFTKKLLLLLKDASISKKKVSGKKRLRLLQDTEKYILKHITEPITIFAIASHFNVSERTLLYAFKNRFGMGPKGFMLILKLNHAHHTLCKENNNKSVASLVRDCGFWHMGQFYKDYKMFFGELPSYTLSTNCLGK